jgi:hypothetical protein
MINHSLTYLIFQKNVNGYQFPTSIYLNQQPVCEREYLRRRGKILLLIVIHFLGMLPPEKNIFRYYLIFNH